MRPSSVTLAQLSDFSQWSRTGADKRAISLLDYVGFVATPDLFFGFAELFCPELIVHDGLHFLHTNFSAEIYEQWLRAGKSPLEIQRVLNHIHVSTLLQSQAVSDGVALEVAGTLAAIWARTLAPEGLVSEVLGTGFEDAAVTFVEGQLHSGAVHPRQGF